MRFGWAFRVGRFGPSAAEGVDETEIAGVVARCGDDVLFAYCHQGDAHPLFPFLWALRVLISIEQQTAAAGASSLLDTEKVPDGRAQRRRCLLAATLDPIIVLLIGSACCRAWSASRRAWVTDPEKMRR